MEANQQWAQTTLRGSELSLRFLQPDESMSTRYSVAKNINKRNAENVRKQTRRRAREAVVVAVDVTVVCCSQNTESDEIRRQQQ